MADIDNFTRESFTFPGNYRAIVEDNIDPLKCGRVRVRILGLHSIDTELTPVEHLPWAEPCLTPYYSGGKNIDNTEKKSEGRYNNGGSFTPPKRDIKEGIPEEYVDTVLQDLGTGGFFTVPRKGSMVWIFFEGGNHTRPHYWSAATKKADWDRQNEKIKDDVQQKIENINELKAKFSPDTTQHKGKSCSSSANVTVKTNKPRMKIKHIEEDNAHITSFTSPCGVTYVFINQEGVERTYIMHKGQLQYSDEWGQMKHLVGTTDGDNNDFEQLIANNYELHINGDFDVFTNNSCFIQVEKDAQISVKGNCGITTRDGDVDIVADSSNVNIDVKKNCNIHSAGNIQMHAEKDMIIKVDGNMSLDVKGTFDAQVSRNVRMKLQDLNLTTDMGIYVQCLLMNVSARTQVSIKAGSLATIGAPLLSFNADGGCFVKGSVISLAAPMVLAGGVVNMGAAQAGSPTITQSPKPQQIARFDQSGATKNQRENSPHSSS